MSFGLRKFGLLLLMLVVAVAVIPALALGVVAFGSATILSPLIGLANLIGTSAGVEIPFINLLVNEIHLEPVPLFFVSIGVGALSALIGFISAKATKACARFINRHVKLSEEL